MKRIKHKGVFFFILVLAILYIVIFVAPKVSGALRSTYEIQYGRLQIYDETTAYVVRNEKVYMAGTAGSENALIEEGTLVRKGTTILKVSGNSDAENQSKYDDIRESLKGKAVTTTSYKAESEGIVSYYIDGYEAALTPKTMEKKTADYYSGLNTSKIASVKRNNVAKGDPVFKMTDRSHWYLVCYIPKDHMERYYAGRTVTVNIGEEARIKARVHSITEEKGGKVRLILDSNYYYEDFAKVRSLSVQIVTSEMPGLIVENSSICEEEGVKGVYVQQKTGEFKFVPINVLATDGKQSAVSESYFYDAKGKYTYTVKNYDVALRKGK